MNLKSTCALALAAFVGLVGSVPTAAAVFDADSYLASAYRSDLYGGEVWTITYSTAGQVRFCEKDAADIERPGALFAEPRPGLQGELHVARSTKMADVLVPEIACVLADGTRSPLAFRSIWNRWTPSGMTTYYRSASAAERDEDPFIGAAALKERKSLTRDNVFIAEATLKNTDDLAREYEISLGFTAPTNAALATTLDGERVRVRLAPHAERTFRYALAFTADGADAARRMAAAELGKADPFAAAKDEVNAWFDRVPRLETDDEDMKKLYYYRWFVVRIATHRNRRVRTDDAYPRTAVYEGPKNFTDAIGLPVPQQVREMGWMRDTADVRDHILNWCDGIRRYPQYIQFTGMSIARFLELHPDPAFAKAVLDKVIADAEKRAGKDPDALPMQVGSWSTGAEHQANFYQFTEPKWDWRWDHTKGFPRSNLVRLDTAGYAAANFLGAARIARMAGDPRADALEERGRRILGMIRARHWDERTGLFLAADPKTGRLADESACYDSFVPYMFGMIDDARTFRAFDRLLDRAWFWDDFAITTTAKNCPLYSGANAIPSGADATRRRPHEYACCWNGPVWHYADSLVAEAFGAAAAKDARLREGWLRFFEAWSRTHFLAGDRSTPRAAEHFRPEDGGRLGLVSDYFHSAWVDPFIRYWCGVSVGADGAPRLDPFTKADFRLANVPMPDGEYVFEQRDGKAEFRRR